MATRLSPTKGNLIATKKSMQLAKLGYDLMDRKRNVLIREMMLLVDKVKILRDQITQTYAEAYLSLQQANISLGVVTQIANAVSIENGVSIVYRSVMGVEIPNVRLEDTELTFEYGFDESNSKLDEASLKFLQAKRMTVLLAEIDNSVFRLARAIQKTQKRANALRNIVLPQLQDDIKFISDALEEKEREEFTRLKVIKNKKARA
ncbi:MAG: V-type ATP synthase subunit D [Erysipelotrichaceae bacterium]